MKYVWGPPRRKEKKRRKSHGEFRAEPFAPKVKIWQQSL
jgi:hypothetical protein